jgi:hypothetical protein
METVLRVALLRFHVNTQSLSRILHVTSTLHRRTLSQHGQGGPDQTNTVAQVILEVLADGLRMKVRILPSTLNSILEVSLISCKSALYSSSAATGHHKQ